MIIRFLCLLARIAIVPFCRLDVRDPHEVREVGPCVLVANHRSLFDVLIGMTAFRWRDLYPRVLIAKDWLPGPLAWVARRSGVIPVDRAAGGSASEAGCQALREGGRIVIMPEGKLHWNPDEPLSFGTVRHGMVRIARSTGAPIVPVAVEGTQWIWPKDSRLPRARPWRRRAVTVSIGAPHYVGDADDTTEAELVMNTIRDLLVAM